MAQSAYASAEASEIQRLKALIPSSLASQIVIVRSTKVNPVLISTEKVGNNRFAVEIDLMQWQQFDLNERDLLFWHEVARVQNGTVKQLPWELAIFGTALAISLMEVVTQNLLLLSVALVVVGLSGNQLYQRNRGERSLREATLADQGAISFALKFGYSFAEANANLSSALTKLSRQASQKTLANKYQTRLRVLEIFASKSQKRPDYYATIY
jgi:hypothetical protein